jgi:hypothetical protein
MLLHLIFLRLLSPRNINAHKYSLLQYLRETKGPTVGKQTR